MKRTAAQMRLNSMVQGNRKGALSSTSCEEMSNNNKQSHRRRLGYLVEHRSNLTPYLCDDQAVGVPHVHQVVKLIVFNRQNVSSQFEVYFRILGWRLYHIVRQMLR